MNSLVKSLSNIARSYLRTTTERCYSTQLQRTAHCPRGHSGSILNNFRQSLHESFQAFQQIRSVVSLLQIHRRGGFCFKKKAKKNPLGEGRPYAKGVVIKTLIKKPKKPNSANRKCVLVRLSTGKEMTAYVPGEGHNLQEHNIVLCRPGRLKDVPGVKIKCVRGKFDLPHVIKKSQ